ncbi:MAG: hypothetical protein Q7U85_03700 [Rhodocyclaceae bacterium]|nr:hypothetical protein [Rhodocyclaceae bacterium]
MTPKTSLKRQRGATLIVGLIMLTLITVMVITAFQQSMGNQRAVGNMQFRDQALAAANIAQERLIAGNLATRITADSNYQVDLNNDGATDISATVKPPTCIAATMEESAKASSLSLGGTMSAEGLWKVTLDLDITANDPVTGASMRVRSGVRVLLTKTEKDAWCI